MKKYLVGLVSAFAVLTLVATPVLAATNSAGQDSMSPPNASLPKSVNTCKTQVKSFLFAETVLTQMDKNHFIMPGTPGGNPLSLYKPNDKARDIAGKKLKLREARSKVPIFKDGQVGKKGTALRTNYQLILQRHQIALGVAKAKAGVNTAKYEVIVKDLEIAVNNNGHNFMQALQGEQKAVHAEAINCKTADGQKKAKTLTSKRTQLVRSAQTSVMAADIQYKKASKEYGFVKTAYNKKTTPKTTD